MKLATTLWTAGLAFALCASSANAALLTTDAQYLIGGATSITDGPHSASGGTVSSTVDLSSSEGADYALSGGQGFAKAVNLNGITAVEANGSFYTGGDRRSLTAEAVYSDTITNTSGVTQKYSYDFVVFGPTLAVGDYAYADVGDITATYVVDISVNGSSVWNSAATLSGGRAGHTLTKSGTDLGGTYFSDFGGHVFGYEFDDFVTDLLLGTLADGESLDFEASVFVKADALPYELGARAFVGDPGDIGGTPGLNGNIVATPTGGPGPSPVPEPETLLLMGLGLLAMQGMRRRKRASSN